MQRYGELEIDIKDLFLWLLRFGYVIIACIVIGAILGGSLAIYKNYKITNFVPEKELTKLIDKMTPKEKKEVDDIIDRMDFAEDMKDALAEDMSSASYSGDDLEDAINRVDYWNGVYNQQYGLAMGLKDEQQEYYDILTADPDKHTKEESILKYAIIGAMFMFCAVSFCFCLVYIFTPTVKTSSELISYFRCPVLRYPSVPEKNAEMLSTDISILMAKASLSSLGVIYDNTSKRENDAAEKIVKNIKVSDNLSVNIIDPLVSPENLKALSSRDSVVIFVTIKETLRSRLQELVSYCDRYGCDILGFVALDSNTKDS